MKNEKELENIKEEIKNLNTELRELSDDELEQVTGGNFFGGTSLLIMVGVVLDTLDAEGSPLNQNGTEKTETNWY